MWPSQLCHSIEYSFIFSSSLWEGNKLDKQWNMTPIARSPYLKTIEYLKNNYSQECFVNSWPSGVNTNNNRYLIRKPQASYLKTRKVGGAVYSQGKIKAVKIEEKDRRKEPLNEITEFIYSSSRINFRRSPPTKNGRSRRSITRTRDAPPTPAPHEAVQRH